MKQNYLMFVSLYFVINMPVFGAKSMWEWFAFHPQQNQEILMTRTVLASVVCHVAVTAAGIWGFVFTSISVFALSLASSSAGYSSLPELNQIF